MLRFVLILGLLLAACGGGTSAATSGPSDEESSLATPIVVSSGALTVTILSPEDGAEVNVPQVAVMGEAPAGVVITLNDEIVVVDQTGKFSAMVPLEEGPNEIDGVASDADGNEVTFELTVTYEPQS